MFDVSIAANMSLAISLVAWLQSNFGMNPLLAVILTLLSGAWSAPATPSSSPSCTWSP
jgi:hypothetical protein